MISGDLQRRASDPPGASLPGWSVVVCAFTEQRWDRLNAALDSLQAQVTTADEVVLVIDNNDMLLRRARVALAGRPVRVVASTGPRGLSSARNTGVDVASHQLIAFLDDDAEADPNWLEQLAEPFVDPGVAGVGGTALPAWAGAEPPRWFPDEFQWVVGCSYKGLPEVSAEIRNPIGANMAFRRSAIEAAGGFSSELGRVGGQVAGGEETDLAIRVRRVTGGVVMLAPEAVVHHHVPLVRTRFAYFLRRCYGEGCSKAILTRRVGARDATASERAYLMTLAMGMVGYARQAVSRRELGPLLQAGALLVGLAATGAGYVVGLAALRLGLGKGRP